MTLSIPDILAGQMPEILAGPIVRRSDAKAIHVWICTSKPLDLGMVVFATTFGKDKKPIVMPGPIGTGRALRRVRLGERLYVHLLKAVPVKSKANTASFFPTGALLSYDIRELTTATPAKLGSSILTPAVLTEISLSGEADLPTVVLQRDSETDLRALFASCRKLHGPGKDAFVKTLKSRYRFPYIAGRPNALLLMGDQIYADDVSALILDRLAMVSRLLIGFKEDVPDRDGSTLSDWKYSARQRQKPIAEAAGFTTTEGANHLARFGEFAAMYLMSWSRDDYFWPLDSLKEKSRKFLDTGQARWEAGTISSAKTEAEEGLREIINLLDAYKGTRALRRILANTPTYMIFDDHDVTDDWNITPAWQDAVEKKNPLGRRIVSNALAAYTVFQGWGNDPDSFADGTVLDCIEARFAKRDVSASTIASYETTLLAFGKWSFLAPTAPPTLFVDSRTRRTRAPHDYEFEFQKSLGERDYLPEPVALPEYIPASPQKWKGDRRDGFVPSLIGPATMKHLEILLDAVTGRRLMLVTPGPVFDLPLLEVGKTLVRKTTAAWKAGTFNEATSVPETDVEAWMTNKHSFMRLMQVLKSANLTKVIMLSGDVHYAFSVAGAVVYDEPKAFCFQLFNSSATKNSPEGNRKFLADSLGNSTAGQWRFYVTEDAQQFAYYVPSLVASQIELDELRTKAKEFYRIDLEFSPLRINGKTGKDTVTTQCNVGFLVIDRASDLALADFMVGT